MQAGQGKIGLPPNTDPVQPMSTTRAATYPIDPLFLRRWSPRAFTGEPIGEPELLALFEAARWAPSGFNAQPWRFVYARRDTPAWPRLFDTLSASNQLWAAKAAALTLVASRTTWVPPGQEGERAIPSHSFDAGAAWASLAFQALLSGWHAHAMGGFDKERARVAVGVPPGHAVEAMVAIGRRGDASLLPESLRERERPNQRLPLAAIVAEGRYSFDDG